MSYYDIVRQVRLLQKNHTSCHTLHMDGKDMDVDMGVCGMLDEETEDMAGCVKTTKQPTDGWSSSMNALFMG